MHKKNIAFVIGSLSSGGAERVVSTLSNELAKRYQITIITFKAVKPFYELDKRINVVHCKDEISPSKNTFEALKTNFTLLKKIIYLFKKHQINICISFLTTPNVLSVLAAKRVGIPVIISERNNPYSEDVDLPKFWKILRNVTYPRANYIVVQTNIIKSYYEKKIKSNRLKVIPNPLNPDFIGYKEVERQNIILNVGRLSKQKGQDILIKAFSNLDPDGWQLHIVGEGNKRDALQQLINHSKMNDKIMLWGRSKRVDEHYRKSKIFAFTSHYEGFPNALIEAMHFGLACVSTDCPSGPSELIRDGENGFLIPVDDQIQLEKKLLSLINDPESIKEMSAASKSITEVLNVDTISKEWEKLF